MGALNTILSMAAGIAVGAAVTSYIANREEDEDDIDMIDEDDDELEEIPDDESDDNSNDSDED